jgi:crotonobetainyl-CoA hydratase
MSGNDNDVLVTTRNQVRLITINRPDRRNARDHAINLRMMNAIIDADHDPEIAMIAVTGAGDKAFCSGADLKADSDQFDTAKHIVGPNLYETEDQKEGVRAYLERRKPEWKGR